MSVATTTITTTTISNGCTDDQQFQLDGHKHSTNENPLYDYGILGAYQQELIYSNVISIGLSHIVALYILLTFPFFQEWDLFLFGLFIGTLGGIGVTAAAHRFYSHRSFKAKTPLIFLFFVLYAIAGHNKIYDWARDHRVHHKFSETDADPHNAKRGFFFAHVGWLLMKKHPEVTRKGKTVDMSDIANDPLVTWYDRHFILMKTIFCFTIPIIIPPLVWGSAWHYSITCTILRYIIVLNCTWLVNSAAHIYGYRPYDKRINPAENIMVSILSCGEGWHNYHHTFPWDYRASEIGKLNITTRFLDLMAKIGLCYDMKYPSEDLIRKVAEKYGDGSHLAYTNVIIDENFCEENSKKST